MPGPDPSAQTTQPAELRAPGVNRDGLDLPGQDGFAIDLTSVDWDVETSTEAAKRGKTVPRFLYPNVSGNVQIVPVGAPADSTGFVIAVVASKPIEFAVRKVVRAGCDAGFRNATAIIAAY